MLNNIKLLLGLSDTSKDKLLTLLISQVQDEARNYIHDSNLNGLDSIIVQMVIYKFNHLGNEGLSSENYSGVSFSYTTEYPSSITDGLKKHRRIGVVHD